MIGSSFGRWLVVNATFSSMSVSISIASAWVRRLRWVPCEEASLARSSSLSSLAMPWVQTVWDFRAQSSSLVPASKTACRG